jgi:hypothetical protein
VECVKIEARVGLVESGSYCGEGVREITELVDLDFAPVGLGRTDMHLDPARRHF